jgi:hypothetical protein
MGPVAEEGQRAARQPGPHPQAGGQSEAQMKRARQQNLQSQAGRRYEAEMKRAGEQDILDLKWQAGR